MALSVAAAAAARAFCAPDTLCWCLQILGTILLLTVIKK
jgi:hypothetical protein